MEGLARELASALRKKFYRAHMVCIRRLGAPSEKLVYLYIFHTQPQSFTTIRRSLALGVKTVDRALKKLKEGGYIVQDNEFLYWLRENKDVE